MPDTKETNKTMNRRELLKALAATGGAVTAATMIPGKWTKPVIEAGVLPVHAATSQYTITVTNVSSGGAVVITGGEISNDRLIVEVTIDPPEAGVAINDEFTNGPFTGGDGPQNTDGNGKAEFDYFLCENLSFGELGNQGCGPTGFSITYSFANPGTFGTATDTVSGTYDTCDCD